MELTRASSSARSATALRSHNYENCARPSCRAELKSPASSQPPQPGKHQSFLGNHMSPGLRAVPEGQNCTTRCHSLYRQALQMARQQDYECAREAFERCVQSCPYFALGWISYAQMEKRVWRKLQEPKPLHRCRNVLQRGLQLNPTSAALCQAWGLMELQKGNILAAVLLLERCVANDPSCSPVLRWKPVQTARQSVSSRRLRAAGLRSKQFA